MSSETLESKPPASAPEEKESCTVDVDREVRELPASALTSGLTADLSHVEIDLIPLGAEAGSQALPDPDYLSHLGHQDACRLVLEPDQRVSPTESLLTDTEGQAQAEGLPEEQKSCENEDSSSSKVEVLSSKAQRPPTPVTAVCMQPELDLLQEQVPPTLAPAALTQELESPTGPSTQEQQTAAQKQVQTLQEQVSPTQEQVPPTQEQVPPTQEQVSLLQEQVSPTQEQVSLLQEQEQVSPTQEPEQVSPTQEQVPPSREQVSLLQEQVSPSAEQTLPRQQCQSEETLMDPMTRECDMKVQSAPDTDVEDITGNLSSQSKSSCVSVPCQGQESQAEFEVDPSYGKPYTHLVLKSHVLEETVNLCFDELEETPSHFQVLPAEQNRKHQTTLTNRTHSGNSETCPEENCIESGDTETNVSENRVKSVSHETDMGKDVIENLPVLPVQNGHVPNSEHSSNALNLKYSFNEVQGLVGRLKESVSRLQREEDLSLFARLPDELMVKIFSYLTVQELCQSVSPVCRQWRLLSHDPSLWKSITFQHSANISSLHLVWILRRAPHLRSLSLRGRANMTLAEISIVTECCRLMQDVDLGFCASLNCDMIKCLVANCLDLRSLNVEGCDHINSTCVKLLSTCQKLQNLNFSHCVLMDEDVILLSETLPKIHSLNLDGISWITDQGVISLVSHHHDHLVSLDLDGAEMSDISIEYISRCRQLKHLAISFCDSLTDAALTNLRELSLLESLKLRKGPDFTSPGISSVFQPPTFQHLHSLDLSECASVDDTTVLKIVQCCGQNLKMLALSWCWFITDVGLISIVDHCSKLETLDLLGIDKITGSCLERIPEEIPFLTLLDLRQCNKIVDSLIMDVIRRKPDLKAINYYGEEFVY